MNAIFLFFVGFLGLLSLLQDHVPTNPDHALEGIIVEKYYEAKRSLKNSREGFYLPKGMTTYRIYVDLKEGYFLQAIYGLPEHPLSIKTTTRFYNDNVYGSYYGCQIHENKVNTGGTALDSWLTIGAATKSHLGVPRSQDIDGSIISLFRSSDGDGLISAKVTDITSYQVNMDAFDNKTDASHFTIDDGACAVFGGVQGPTSDNLILVAQVTTDGILSFELNIQIIDSNCQKVEKYVARNPKKDEIQSAKLIYP